MTKNDEVFGELWKGCLGCLYDIEEVIRMAGARKVWMRDGLARIILGDSKTKIVCSNHHITLQSQDERSDEMIPQIANVRRSAFAETTTGTVCEGDDWERAVC